MEIQSIQILIFGFVLGVLVSFTLTYWKLGILFKNNYEIKIIEKK